MTVEQKPKEENEEVGQFSNTSESNESLCSSEECRLSCVSRSEILGISDQKIKSTVSLSSEDVDLELGTPEIKGHLGKSEKDCRICHLNLENGNHEYGVPIELGCSCKDDLANAHKNCAEAWFKIRGNKTCEICGQAASNVVDTSDTEFMEHWNETNNGLTPISSSETRSFWHSHRFLNFLLACMVFAFIISWFFHFNVPS